MTASSATAFPFTAVVGNEDLKRSLLVNVVDPRIGGVLIRGDRGTAKTTIVRALAPLLPRVRVRAGCAAGCDPATSECPFCDGTGEPLERPARIVELPLGATEDRIAGTIDLARVMRSGERRLEPGLLAQADRGVLYIDEVNLLPDHLVDLLLDVAASGVNVVERDGTSISHPARFILVGTMNPEEGDLRPQLLDRFGLVIDTHTPLEPTTRAEIVRRRVEFDRYPEPFAVRFAAEERALYERISRAREALGTVTMPADMLALAVELCLEAKADGLRPDIALYRTAIALAALDDRGRVEERDIYAAALLALPHRQHRSPDGMLAAPPIEDIVHSRETHDDPQDASDEGGRGAVPPPHIDPNSDGSSRGSDVPRSSVEPALAPVDDGTANERPPDRLVRPMGRSHIPLPAIRTHRSLAGAESGRRRRPIHANDGRAIGNLAWNVANRSDDLAVLATFTAAIMRGASGTPEPVDVRVYRRASAPRRLVLLLVDGSGSMGTRERMARTKAALLDIVDQAALHRDAAALEVFRDDAVQLLVRPTRNLTLVRAGIRTLPTGGRTPLSEGLREAARITRRERARGRYADILLVIATDARVRGDIAAWAEAVRPQLSSTLVIDTEADTLRLSRARVLAAALGAGYAPLPSFN